MLKLFVHFRIDGELYCCIITLHDHSVPWEINVIGIVSCRNSGLVLSVAEMLLSVVAALEKYIYGWVSIVMSDNIHFQLSIN